MNLLPDFFSSIQEAGIMGWLIFFWQVIIVSIIIGAQKVKRFPLCEFQRVDEVGCEIKYRFTGKQLFNLIVIAMKRDAFPPRPAKGQAPQHHSVEVTLFLNHEKLCCRRFDFMEARGKGEVVAVLQLEHQIKFDSFTAHPNDVVTICFQAHHGSFDVKASTARTLGFHIGHLLGIAPTPPPKKSLSKRQPANHLAGQTTPKV